MANQKTPPLTIGDAIILLDNLALAHASNPRERQALTEVTARRFFALRTRNVRVVE